MVYEEFFLFVVVCANLKLAESYCTSLERSTWSSTSYAICVKLFRMKLLDYNIKMTILDIKFLSQFVQISN